MIKLQNSLESGSPNMLPIITFYTSCGFHSGSDEQETQYDDVDLFVKRKDK
jgi:hypothetical protein